MLQMLARHHHRRGAKAVLGEYARHPRAVVEPDHQQILAARLADAGFARCPSVTPFTGSNDSGSGGNRLTGMAFDNLRCQLE